MEDEQNLLNADLAPKQEVSPEASVEAVPEKLELAQGQESAPTTESLQPKESPVAVEISEAPTASPIVVQNTLEKDEMTKAVEGILSDDLEDLFLRLPPEKKVAFKVVGEEAALKIKIMMTSGKLKAKKVLEIIRDWLRIVPGVNKFFLEQEAKIKTDQVMEYYEEKSSTDPNAL